MENLENIFEALINLLLAIMEGLGDVFMSTYFWVLLLGIVLGIGIGLVI